MKVKPFHQFIEKIRSNQIPFSVVFEITSRCNLSCLHCYQGKGRGELGLSKIKSTLDDLGQTGCMKLTLTGGEPTLREDFLEIYSYSHRKGFAITLFTNGTLFNGDLRKKILKEPPFVVECSLYGASAKLHDSITQTEGSFEISLHNIKWMIEQGIRTTVKSVILSLNFHDIRSLYNLCSGLGVPFHPTYRVFPSMDPTRFPEKLRIKTEEMKTWLRETGNPFAKRIREPESSSDSFICNAGREACCIGAEGKVYPCVALRWECGDLKKKDFPEIWAQSSVLQKIRSYKEDDFHACFRCPWRADCNFCPGMGFSEHGDMLIPSKELCRITQAMTKERAMSKQEGTD